MKIKHVWFTLCFLLGIVFLANSQTTSKSAQTPTKTTESTALLVGKWKGSYDGGTPGTCEMEFSRKANGTLSGQIVIHPEGGEKSTPATFDSVKLEGNSLTASFSDPDGNPIQVEGKLESKQLKGTWKTANNEGGSWQTTKSQ
ncbi:hypothetical protein Q0590_28405 [Rhodocytophaga aerolata]|uniref:Lipocalin family protein n=1 Tax=Rhodocytophaga aerolata TaxID=455078 RepID=A0ABT8REW7_9BACT|nr:hypothetical protein [Rhodocytophaga aerolata]MDO1450236.1 hypothetical protein [Rhodocytophaga aerolata]